MSRARSSPRTRAAGDAASEAWRLRAWSPREASPSSRWSSSSRRASASPRLSTLGRRDRSRGRPGPGRPVPAARGSGTSLCAGRTCQARAVGEGQSRVSLDAASGRRAGRAVARERETDGRDVADAGARGRRRRAHLRLGATLRSAARSAASRLWKNDLREGWKPPEEAECGRLARSALPWTSPCRRRALEPNGAGISRDAATRRAVQLAAECHVDSPATAHRSTGSRVARSSLGARRVCGARRSAAGDVRGGSFFRFVRKTFTVYS